MSTPIALKISLALAIVASSYAGTVSPLDKTPQPTNLESAVTFDPISSSWTLSAGYQWREMGSLNFHTGSAAAHSALPWMAGGSNRSTSNGSSFGDPNATGSASAYADRTYSDGFVNQDGGTPFGGTTGFFGYNNDSQVQGTNLNYHSSSGTTTTSSITSSSHVESASMRSDLGWNSDVSGSGFFTSLGSPALFRSGSIAVSLDLGYSFATADTSHETPGVFQAHQESVQHTSSSSTTSTNNVTDSYDVTGLILPSAPYAGTFAGPGPLINNIPTNRSSTNSTITTPGRSSTSVSTADFSSNVTEGLRMKLNTISFGPHLTWETGRISLGLSAGFALNIADWDSTYREELNVRQGGGAYRLLKAYQYENSGLKALPGAYGELNANYRLTKHVALFVGGRYDWAGTIHGDAGPSSFDFKVRGASVQGGLTWVF